MLFRAHFIDPLRAFLTVSPSSIVLIVPSVRDLTSNHAAFPQPEFDADLFGFNPVCFRFVVAYASFNSCRKNQAHTFTAQSREIYSKWDFIRHNER